MLYGVAVCYIRYVLSPLAPLSSLVSARHVLSLTSLIKAVLSRSAPGRNLVPNTYSLTSSHANDEPWDELDGGLLPRSLGQTCCLSGCGACVELADINLGPYSFSRGIYVNAISPFNLANLRARCQREREGGKEGKRRIRSYVIIVDGIITLLVTILPDVRRIISSGGDQY